MASIYPHLECQREILSLIFKPYFTLEESLGPLNAYGPHLAYQRMQAGADIESNYLLIQRIMPAAFRAMLADNIGCAAFGGISPLTVSPIDRSQQWQHLCDTLLSLGKLTKTQLHALCHVLLTLGYFDYIFFLTQDYSTCQEGTDEQTAALAYMHCSTRYILCMGNGDYSPDDVRLVAQRAPRRSRSRFLASSRLLMFYGRFAHDLDQVEYWREHNLQCLQDLPLEPNSVYWCILWSRFWRSACFYPLLRKDYARTFEELKHAEDLARQPHCNTQHEYVLCLANLYPVLQSINRLATIVGDEKLAFSLSREMVTLDPWYSTAHVDLGTVLMREGDLESAALSFLRGSLLG
ncbi:MAG TPA: hypothetical protein VKB86_15625, partial [Pyrinomonadaceae bacterium]|nr:hypothetical protein [Pyrinomonadaceae bacterium]